MGGKGERGKIEKPQTAVLRKEKENMGYQVIKLNFCWDGILQI